MLLELLQILLVLLMLLLVLLGFRTPFASGGKQLLLELLQVLLLLALLLLRRCTTMVGAMLDYVCYFFGVFTTLQYDMLFVLCVKVDDFIAP